MVRSVSIVVLLVLVLAGSVAAQTPAAPAPAPPPAPAPAPRSDRDLRHQIYVMEGALARAVQFGAQQVNREIRNASPDIFSLAGEAQARGVYLEGYGVFFDVGVPILRQSMMWSFRTMMEQDDRSLRQAVDLLREIRAVERNPAKQRQIENSIASLEIKINPSPDPARAAAQPAGVGASLIAPEGPSVAPTPMPTIPPVAERPVMQDPNRAYTDSVQRALVDAMIDYSAPMLLGENEWLTVAARDNEPRDTFAPQDPYEEVVTVLLRIRGADLAAYRAGRIDREDAKKRVQIRQF